MPIILTTLSRSAVFGLGTGVGFGALTKTEKLTSTIALGLSAFYLYKKSK